MNTQLIEALRAIIRANRIQNLNPNVVDACHEELEARGISQDVLYIDDYTYELYKEKNMLDYYAIEPTPRVSLCDTISATCCGDCRQTGIRQPLAVEG